MKPLAFCVVFFFSYTLSAWNSHHLLTSLALEEVTWLKQFKLVKATAFQEFLSKAFSSDFTQKDFLKQYQLNPETQIHVKKGEMTSAISILSRYSDEPDWGMDRNLDISPDQKYMGGTKGPTSQAFRHLHFKKWSIKAPWRTFHVPLREMGEALHRAQIFYDLAQTAFAVKEPYWAFRFLAWSLHYIQDLGQPFHSSQLLTPKFVAWDSIFPFEKLIKRTTQIISNYHFIYEDYVIYRIQKELDPRFRGDDRGLFMQALKGSDSVTSSSAFLIAKHSADSSNHLSYKIGENCYRFFGEKFLAPEVDVPNAPQGTFPVAQFDKSSRLPTKEKLLFLKDTAQALKKTGLHTRSLLELAKKEFLDPPVKPGDDSSTSP